MLTISRLGRSSIRYYNRTADQAAQASMDRQAAGGGLGEYYSELDSRAPVWLVCGDRDRVGELTGLSAGGVRGGFADTATAADWLDDGRAPNGLRGRAFRADAVHGFDLTFAAPKSVSLVRGLGNEVAGKTVVAAHLKAVEAAMAYLCDHAGYTRIYRGSRGVGNLQRLPGLVAIAYQHETSRCGDPHLHTHVIVPNRQARADGQLVSLDSKSLFYEAKAAGVIYQAALRAELHAQMGVEWQSVEVRTGQAEIAGIPREEIIAWSQRSTRLREWARDNLRMVDGGWTAAQLGTAQKATRPSKPESLSWGQLRGQWLADARGLSFDAQAHQAARAERLAAARGPLDRARATQMAMHIDKATFTRADLVQVIGAQLPVDAAGDPRQLVEAMVADVAVRATPQRAAHQRERSVKYTVVGVIAEEQRILQMSGQADTRTLLDVRGEDVADLSADQRRAISKIADSPFLVQPLQAPAGAGKTHSLKALRAAAHRSGKQVLVLAPTGKAVDEAMRDGAGDRGLTVAKALKMIQDTTLAIDRKTLVVVDEASMVGTGDLKKLLSCAVVGRVKMVLVGDPYQLGPVRARGGMFELLCAELPWAQRLSQVWRMRDPAERDASLALRSGRGNRLRRAVGWYRMRGRLHTGDPIAMAHDAEAAYRTARAEGWDMAILCDRWEIADAINARLHTVYTPADAPAVTAARDQQVCAGDLIMTRNNDATIPVSAADGSNRPTDQVRNGNRWTVVAVNPVHGRIAAERHADGARAIFANDYVREHITLGYAGTVHSAQGMTVGSSTRYGVCWSIMSENAGRALAYVAATRATDENHLAIYQPHRGEADHEHRDLTDATTVHRLRRGTKYEAAHYLSQILQNAERPRCLHAEAERSHPDLLPEPVAAAAETLAAQRATWTAAYRQTQAYDRAVTDTYAAQARRLAERETRGHAGYGMELYG